MSLFALCHLHVFLSALYNPQYHISIKACGDSNCQWEIQVVLQEVGGKKINNLMFCMQMQLSMVPFHQYGWLMFYYLAGILVWLTGGGGHRLSVWQV